MKPYIIFISFFLVTFCTKKPSTDQQEISLVNNNKEPPQTTQSLESSETAELASEQSNLYIIGVEPDDKTLEDLNEIWGSISKKSEEASLGLLGLEKLFKAEAYKGLRTARG